MAKENEEKKPTLRKPGSKAKVEKKVSADETSKADEIKAAPKKVPYRRPAGKKVIGKAKNVVVEDDEDDSIIFKGLTDIEKEKIRREVLAARKKITLTVAPDDYVRIQVALKISSLNPQNLCTWANDKITRGETILDFATATPSWADITLLYNKLAPLAAIGRGYIAPGDKTKRINYTASLKGMFQDNANDCAKIAVGNLPFYQLIGYGAKGFPIRHRGTAAMCVAKTNNKKGAGKMGVSCKPIVFIDKYVIYYGTTPEYDAATWKFKVGSSNQIITGLTSGVAYYFIMVAIGTDGEGEWMEPIRRVVPFA